MDKLTKLPSVLLTICVFGANPVHALDPQIDSPDSLVATGSMGLATSAGTTPRAFSAELENCTELIGFGPIPLSKAIPLVPAPYMISEALPGSAGLVVRASRCEAISIGGMAATAGIVAQIGIAVASPDGTGDINNYSLLYVTNNALLGLALRRAGLPAQVDPKLTYEISPDASGNSHEIFVAVKPTLGVYFLSGSAAPLPLNGAVPTVANWWFNTERTAIKMSTSIPAIAYGPAAFSIHTSKFSPVGQMISGNTDANFVFFNARGQFSSGRLEVALR